jgi:hypothetical protein
LVCQSTCICSAVQSTLGLFSQRSARVDGHRRSACL